MNIIIPEKKDLSINSFSDFLMNIFEDESLGLNFQKISKPEIKSGFYCLLNDINNNIIDIDQLSIVDRTNKTNTFNVSKRGSFTFLSQCNKFATSIIPISNIDIFLERTYKLLQNLYEYYDNVNLKSLKLMIIDIIVSLYFIKHTLSPEKEGDSLRNINGIMNLFNINHDEVTEITIGGYGDNKVIEIFDILGTSLSKKNLNFAVDTFNKINITRGEISSIITTFDKLYGLFYSQLLHKDIHISASYIGTEEYDGVTTLDDLIYFIYLNYNFNIFNVGIYYRNAIRAIRYPTIIKLSYEYKKGEIFNPKRLYAQFANEDFQNSIIKALIEDGIINDGGERVRSLLKTIPGTNITLIGGKNKASIKKQTAERILINGKKRMIYIGTRGGKYIKQSGKFISVKKLT